MGLTRYPNWETKDD